MKAVLASLGSVIVVGGMLATTPILVAVSGGSALALGGVGILAYRAYQRWQAEEE